jgi:hypothetical protein
MGYLHIDNLYKDPYILQFKECYALEKIHGTSAHIKVQQGVLSFFSGGEKHTNFVQLFSSEQCDLFKNLMPQVELTLFGEAYGGNCQGMSATYGNKLKFVVFDVRVNTTWLPVPKAEKFVVELGLEFVDYALIPCTIEAIDAERDKDSTQAIRNGCGTGKIREGVVLRPLMEGMHNNGSELGRIISKHKRAEFGERASQVEVNPEKLKVLDDARAIAEEWVTPMRLAHVLDKLRGDGLVGNGDGNGNVLGMECIPDIIKAMIEDILREGAGEIVDSKDARRAIGKLTVALYKKQVNAKIGVEL